MIFGDPAFSRKLQTRSEDHRRNRRGEGATKEKKMQKKSCAPIVPSPISHTIDLQRGAWWPQGPKWCLSHSLCEAADEPWAAPCPRKAIMNAFSMEGVVVKFKTHRLVFDAPWLPPTTGWTILILSADIPAPLVFLILWCCHHEVFVFSWESRDLLFSFSPWFLWRNLDFHPCESRKCSSLRMCLFCSWSALLSSFKRQPAVMTSGPYRRTPNLVPPSFWNTTWTHKGKFTYGDKWMLSNLVLGLTVLNSIMDTWYKKKHLPFHWNSKVFVYVFGAILLLEQLYFLNAAMFSTGMWWVVSIVDRAWEVSRDIYVWASQPQQMSETFTEHHPFFHSIVRSNLD